ncbi:hypothetical protein SAMN05216381_0384 [Pseudomonas seleniipraecipitans]|uniref:PilZ domain-containing protein n=1 Tax=Phytopseudomonas seleniipraecipitans TaxID=640205 RepID=A0A1G7GXT0_9GAMM|nr:hypothetical protein SAMN05216381_0384 [Pseudomonas seleniipraecipitans]
MQDSSLLTPLEMEFIQQLTESSPAPVETDPGLQVDAARQTAELLASCAAKEQLTIEAHIDNQRLSFTPHLVTDEQNTPHLELGVPQIFEEGSFDRSWRLPLDPPRALLARDGQPTSLLIHELSLSGLLAAQMADASPPERFSLAMDIDEPAPIILQGSLVRVTDDGLLAYELTLDEDNGKGLRHYLYQQHRSLYGPIDRV